MLQLLDQRHKATMINMLSTFGVTGWFNRLSVRLSVLAQVMISWFLSSRPASGPVLTAQSLEPASDPVTPPLPASPQLTLCPLKMNKR